MKIYVLGCGSIGKRHIKNLCSLQRSEITAFDPLEERREAVSNKYGISVYSIMEEGFEDNPDAVIVASPTSFHYEQIMLGALKDCHLFIEKPISHVLDGITDFLDIVEKKKLIVLVAYNLRYHPVVKTVKAMLESGQIGKIISGYVEYGMYLPDWHPWEDYRNGYSARSELGGGVILDVSHEIDYMMWLMGNVTDVFSVTRKASSLEIDTEDIADILVQFESGAHGMIHLDYIQRQRSRTGKIIGEDGTITWDINNGEVRIFTASSGEWKIEYPGRNYDFNQGYIDELNYFINCVEKNEKAYPNEINGKRVLEVGLAAKRSFIEKRQISL